MTFIILLLALIAAGIFTHAVIWYILAGVLVGLSILVYTIVLVGAGIAIKKANKEFKDFDRSDFFKRF